MGCLVKRAQGGCRRRTRPGGMFGCMRRSGLREVVGGEVQGGMLYEEKRAQGGCRRRMGAKRRKCPTYGNNKSDIFIFFKIIFPEFLFRKYYLNF